MLRATHLQFEVVMVVVFVRPVLNHKLTTQRPTLFVLAKLLPKLPGARSYRSPHLCAASSWSFCFSFCLSFLMTLEFCNCCLDSFSPGQVKGHFSYSSHSHVI